MSYLHADVPDGTFLTYITSPDLANQTSDLFEQASGQCIQYIELSNGNHYAATDWNPATAPHQATLHCTCPTTSMLHFFSALTYTFVMHCCEGIWGLDMQPACAFAEATAAVLIVVIALEAIAGNTIGHFS